MSDSDNIIQGRARKRKKNFDRWSRNRKKYWRNRGDPYIAKNRCPVPGRGMGPPCKCGCFTPLGQDKIKEIFQKF